MSAQTSSLRIAALCLLAIGPALLLVSLMVLPSSPLRRRLERYIDTLDGHLRFVRSGVTGRQVLGWQLGAFVFIAVLADVVAPVIALLELVVLFGPGIQIRGARERRMVRIEQQLDGWLLMLANALKAVPSLGDALESSQALVHAPMSEELDVALKEYRLGTPLDMALFHLGERVQSRVVTTAMTMLQVARRTGGDLPATLETSAASLRELARLEGVVRTKTADGKNQAMVVGVLPLIVTVILYFMHPDLLLPLFQTFNGNILLGIAIALWSGAIVSSLQILKVDI